MISLVWKWAMLNKKLVAYLLAFLLVVGYVFYNAKTIASLQENLQITNSELTAAKDRLTILDVGYSELVKRTDKMQVDLNRYFFLTKEAETKYQKSITLLNSLKDRESQVSSDPISLSRDIRAEVLDFEKQYSCTVTGNLESCSQ